MSLTKRNLMVAYMIREVNPLPAELKLTEQERNAIKEKLRQRADDQMFEVSPRYPITDTHLLELMARGKLNERELKAAYWLQDYVLQKHTTKQELRWC